VTDLHVPDYARPEPVELVDTLEPIRRLTRDLRKASATLGKKEARFLVDTYYTVQEQRIRSAGQIRAIGGESEPHAVLDWTMQNFERLEGDLKKALDAYSMSELPGEWMRSICGLGPVIAAGLLAHIDIERAPTVGHIWSYAGLNPEAKWEKGQKRPWNATLKVLLAFKLGESFVKVQNRESDIYGKVYAARKAYEQAKNERGEYAEQAAEALQNKKYGRETEAYKHYIHGHLPPARIHARARRFAAKLFVAHLHEVMYFVRFGCMPPFPYIFEHVEGHTDLILAPNSDVIPGLPEAQEAHLESFRKRGTKGKVVIGSEDDGEE
jgi:hypothetical protein